MRKHNLSLQSKTLKTQYFNLHSVISGVLNNFNKETFNILKTPSPTTCLIRPTSFFAKSKHILLSFTFWTKNIRSKINSKTSDTAETLWKSVTSVSNAGKNRGRGRGAKKAMKNLNRGQAIGVGKINMLWPGLTGPIMSGRNVVKQRRLPDDPEREAKLIKMRGSMFKGRSKRQHPLERGWTSAKMGGKSIGPPDPVLDGKYLTLLCWSMFWFVWIFVLYLQILDFSRRNRMNSIVVYVLETMIVYF